MTADPLTMIAKSLALFGALVLELRVSAPWALESQIDEEDCRAYMPVPRQVIAYHVIVEGSALVFLHGNEVCRLNPGDLLLLPSNARHVIASAPGLVPVRADSLPMTIGEDGMIRMSAGGDGPTTTVLCGFMASNAGPNPLLDNMPTTLKISIPEISTQRWIEATAGLVARELAAGRAGAGAMMSQLCELLMIEALRAHLADSHQPDGWLAGMANPRLARALARVHADLASPPAVTELAEIAGMSRSAFVERFTEIMGQGPRAYVLAQRIETASLLLRETGLGLAEIAHRVGYEAPESFSRAFKRATGKSPAEWRRGPGAAAGF